MTKNKKVCICADDFGLSDSISEGVIDLAKKKRIQAVSCIVNKKPFLKYYKKLIKYRKNLDIGLHINLTENEKGVNLRFNNLYNTLKSLFLIIFKKKLIKKEIVIQIRKFEKYFKFKPNHIDGHHHIHQYPIIRSLIVNCVKNFDPFIRQSGDKFFNILSRKISILKAIIISFFCNKLKCILKKNNLKYNKSFSGIYNFKINKNYKSNFYKFLKKISNQHILMCHPAKKKFNDNYKDTILEARFKEYFFYNGRDFNKIIKNEKIKLIPASKF
tara:strand:- start:48 stop:863 length:816 start_codon:yes stop_codon:yes gene_type:complete